MSLRSTFQFYFGERKFELRVCVHRRAWLGSRYKACAFQTNNFEGLEMTLMKDVHGRRRNNFVWMLVGLTLTLTRGASAQTNEAKPAEGKLGAETYQTIYLTNITQPNEANEVVTAIRNMSPRIKVFYMSSADAVSLRGNADDMQMAQKIIAEFDKPKRNYRLNYSITESDGGKRLGTQRFSLTVAAGGRETLKQGNRMPLVTGVAEAGSSGQVSQVQYIDVGMNIDASVDGAADGVRLHSKIEQSGAAEEKSGLGAQDPIIRQNTLDGTWILLPGKPLILGSLDVPGSTRHLEIEVVVEVVK